MQSQAKDGPVFVLCCARSGSTLVRYILDSHPIFCCPPELHLVWLAKNLSWIYGMTLSSGHRKPVERMEPIVVRRTRANIEEIMREYVERRQKVVWCEKSVFTVDNVGLIGEIFPDARYICLYRHCLDQVQSSLETLENFPTGREYGLDRFLERAPENPVDGLVAHWQAKTAAILKFEKENRKQCIRLRYEDIAVDSKVQLSRLFDFLDAHWDEGMLDTIFTSARRGGAGDHKIMKTNKILTSSVGRGNNLDVQSIPPDRIESANRLLRELDYDPIDQ